MFYLLTWCIIKVSIVFALFSFCFIERILSFAYCKGTLFTVNFSEQCLHENNNFPMHGNMKSGGHEIWVRITLEQSNSLKKLRLFHCIIPIFSRGEDRRRGEEERRFPLIDYTRLTLPEFIKPHFYLACTLHYMRTCAYVCSCPHKSWACSVKVIPNFQKQVTHVCIGLSQTDQ